MPRPSRLFACALLVLVPGVLCADEPPKLQKTLNLHRQPIGNRVFSLAYSRDGSMLFAGAHHDVRGWDLKADEESFVYKYGTGKAKVAVSPDGKTVAVSRYRAVELLDPATGAVRSKHQSEGVDEYLAFSPDGKTLARGEGAVVTLYDFPGMKKRVALDCKSKASNGTHAVAFSPDGKLVAVGLQDKGVRVFEVGGKQLFRLEGYKGPVWSVAFSPDGKTLATGAGDLSRALDPSDGEIKLWEVASGKELAQAKVHPWYVCALAYSPDGAVLASGSWAKGAYQKAGIVLSDANTLKEVGRCEGHQGQTMALAFSPDGKVLVSGGTDSKIHFWEMPQKK